MRARLFTVSAAASALLCSGTCVLWVRSYRTMDTVHWTRERPTIAGADVRPGRWRTVDTDSLAGVSNRGMLLVESELLSGVERSPEESNLAGASWKPAAAEQDAYAIRSRGEDGPWDRVGISLWHFSPDPAVGAFHGATGIRFPAWMLVVTMAVLPARWLVKWYERRRRRRGGGGRSCPACGNDFRATPDRCPECGTGTRRPAGAVGVNRRR